MTERYDVAIAGAGPAGAQAARDLAARGYDVVVLEAESEADFPRTSNKSTGGTFPSMLSSFNVPDDVVMNFTDSVVIESPNDHFERKQSGAVLEFAEFKQFLVEDGQQNGAEYRFGARATGALIEDDAVSGIEYNGDQAVRAEIVIDATGPAAPLAQELGVVELERERQAIGVEWEFEGVELDYPGYADLTDAMMLRLDHDFAPGGYSWIFHTGEDRAKVGVCYLQNEHHERYAADGLGIDGYLDRWIDTDPRFADATRLEGKNHRGSAHIQPPASLSTDGFMAIGDTVPTVDPLWGEGIHKGMKSARAAASVADRALSFSEPDTSAESMTVYDRLWHDEVAPNAKTRLLMTELMYFAPNDRFDQLMEDLRAADDDVLKRVNDGDRLAMRKLVHFSDLPMLADFTRLQLAGS